MIKSLLIANRGEIACHIIRTARRLNIRTIAIYSAADRQALHAQLADKAVPLYSVGKEAFSATDTYLNHALILEIAKAEGAEAIHPGYGFLSENAGFARKVSDAGLIFVGPSADAIAAMGSKSQAKQLMSEAGVPQLPGYHGADQSVATLQKHADEIAYPVLIKASAGGGGRGMRVVQSSSEFAEALASVKREAKAAFSDDQVLLEKYLPNARHVEIQVFSDSQGNCIHLHERDCSIQRRHQKLIEEAPAPGLTEETRQAMGEAAVNAAKAINYSGAGTVEFLYQDGEFYFLEMNTRLQVEHPVTEFITGLDLVEWQLRVASGEALPAQQDDIKRQGWAMEARINAESGAPDFLPSTGTITHLAWPQDEQVRVDAGFRSGDRISVYYDSLLGKVICHGSCREEAAARLSAALAQLKIVGIDHNASYLGAIVDTAAFRRGDVTTAFLQKHHEAIAASLATRAMSQPQTRAAASDTASLTSHAGHHAGDWGALNAWRTQQSEASRRYHLDALYLSPRFAGGTPSPATLPEALSGAGHAGEAQRHIRAPLPGRVIALQVKAGDKVEAGSALLVMEAMKMEHTLRASHDGVIAELHCNEGDMVQPDQLLMELDA
ncbi:MAG: 3-methylcrotonyl-CoA carboxylase [Gammaproteobacteria bacterium]|nr:3-methylcrotonyl-CoA carboxylase [Gammaproteobacteria bacterium]|tara:strand:+ start:383 stop:2212 length:1830 start_codon:yes stop_codon:yes gene_type:complete